MAAPDFRVLFLAWCVTSVSPAIADVPATVVNTQEETIPLLGPEEARAAWKLPAGFHVTTFAHEPDVRQPIAMTFDARGRLWVAECDTYSDSKQNFDLKQRDRIVIFEDTNGDGRADSRKVFWDEGHHLTSVEVGFGGVWVLCAPHLLFIPDRDGDDVPDHEPEIILEGWDNEFIRHNIVNGLKWGPDGWLYGRHGITTSSFIGFPGTPAEERTEINCGIWRYHPVSKKFEVVARGTTNPWGHDWNEQGELFFINTVIGHLWHALPGAHYQRMFGEHANPHLYQLMPQTADHVHWDTSEAWSDIRKTGVTATTDEAGGGHAHCGMMIYLGDNWPAEYRGELFTLNLHGLRINQDHLVREGAGYVGRHRPDFARTGDPWFRGIELSYGPDGGVYVLDWSDIGECHENDGIHRTSGRIYKITYGDPATPPVRDLAKLSNSELIELLTHPNEWFPRTARRLLQERAVAGDDLNPIIGPLREMMQSGDTVPHRLRALWCLNSIGHLEISLLISLLDDPHEAIRSQAAALLSDTEIEDETIIQALVHRADEETSGLVLLRLASALHRLPLEQRFELATPLLEKEEFAHDPHLPLMIWYGLEPAVGSNLSRSVELLTTARMPLPRQFIARRIAAEHRTHPQGTDLLVQVLGDSEEPFSADILRGMAAALEGWRKATVPQGWKTVSGRISEQGGDESQRLARELSVVFGDGRALDELRKIALAGNEPVSKRQNAIRALVTARDPQAIEILQKLLPDRSLTTDAMRGLAAFEHPQTPELILQTYARIRGPGRQVAIETLASRPEYARVLVQAVADGKIRREDVSAFLIRQLRAFDDASLQASVQKLWPEFRPTSEQKVRKIAEYTTMLSVRPEAEDNIELGRELFQKSCANCHTLFGTGGKIGPDLTGSQRGNLHYLLENIVDPSAQVAEKYRMSIMALADGRVISGVILRKTGETTVIQTPNEELTVLNEDIDAVRHSELSMMPDNLLDPLTSQQIRHLMAYLMKDAPALTSTDGE